MSVSRRTLLKAAGAAALVSKTRQTFSIGKLPKNERPNVLFLMSDQHRGDGMGCDGNAAILTPNMDRIAEEGVRFSKAYSSTPTCTPARAAILTGLSPWRHGMVGFGQVAPKYPLEMPQAMRDQGYQTCGIGKMHWNPQRGLHGFHRTILDESSREKTVDFRSDYRAWFFSQSPNQDPDITGILWNDYRSAVYVHPEELHPTHWTGQTAINYLDAYEGTDPFFLKVSFARPHSPYDPPQRFWNLYNEADIPPAAVGDWAARYAPRSDDTNQIWHGDMGAEQVRKSRQGYYGSVSFVDYQIGRILESLENKGILERTLIVYTSDHGDMTGDHHLWRKSYAYEASARVPMLMRLPSEYYDKPVASVRTEPVELRDLLPTFLEAASAPAEVSADLDGKSMLRLARGESEGWREVIDLEHDICYSPKNHWSALTDGKVKYIYHAIDGEEQLFDLEKDSNEKVNLATDAAHSDSVRAWRKRLVDHLSERGEPFVRNGDLAPRPESFRLSPHYPSAPA